MLPCLSEQAIMPCLQEALIYGEALDSGGEEGGGPDPAAAAAGPTGAAAGAAAAAAAAAGGLKYSLKIVDSLVNIGPIRDMAVGGLGARAACCVAVGGGCWLLCRPAGRLPGKRGAEGEGGGLASWASLQSSAQSGAPTAAVLHSLLPPIGLVEL